MAVDSLGHLLALHITPANFDDRTEVGNLADTKLQTTGDLIKFDHADEGYRGKGTATRRVRQELNFKWLN